MNQVCRKLFLDCTKETVWVLLSGMEDDNMSYCYSHDARYRTIKIALVSM